MYKVKRLLMLTLIIIVFSYTTPSESQAIIIPQTQVAFTREWTPAYTQYNAPWGNSSSATITGASGLTTATATSDHPGKIGAYVSIANDSSHPDYDFYANAQAETLDKFTVGGGVGSTTVIFDFLLEGSIEQSNVDIDYTWQFYSHNNPGYTNGSLLTMTNDDANNVVSGNGIFDINRTAQYTMDVAYSTQYTVVTFLNLVATDPWNNTGYGIGNFLNSSYITGVTFGNVNDSITWDSEQYYQTLPSNGTDPVPEPSTIALLGIGIVGLGGAAIRRRLRKTKQ